VAIAAQNGMIRQLMEGMKGLEDMIGEQQKQITQFVSTAPEPHKPQQPVAKPSAQPLKLNVPPKQTMVQKSSSDAPPPVAAPRKRAIQHHRRGK
jgi:hypothetical protein